LSKPNSVQPRCHKIQRFFQNIRSPTIVLLFLIFASVSCTSTLTSSPSIASVFANPSVTIQADLNNIARNSLPPALFSFNMNWVSFQEGFFKDGTVRREIIDWLRPFHGAMYRYPGGALANVFEFRKSIGLSSSRSTQISFKNKPAIAKLGSFEYLNFVSSVGGVPFITANLRGTSTNNWTLDQVVDNATDWALTINKGKTPLKDRAEPICIDPASCHAYWWELGNELDFSGKLSPSDYVVLANNVATHLKQSDPNLRVIPHTATAVFSEKRGGMSRANAFNEQVLRGTSEIADAYALHAYYDSSNIPRWLKYISKLEDEIRSTRGGTSAPIFITEHARYAGSFDESETRTLNLEGALIMSDFLIGLFQMPFVDGAMWHVLGSAGPYRLFQRDQEDIFPHAPYWALRALRAGALDQVLTTKTLSSRLPGIDYSSKVRAVLTRDTQNTQRFGLLIVNLADKVIHVNLRVHGMTDGTYIGQRHAVSGESLMVVNTPLHPNAISLNTDGFSFDYNIALGGDFDIPKYSVIAYVFEKEH